MCQQIFKDAKKQEDSVIAALSAKIWFEWKILATILVLLLVLRIQYDFPGLVELPVIFWLCYFWINDAKYNKKSGKMDFSENCSHRQRQKICPCHLQNGW